VDLSFTPEEEAFRTELRSYLTSTLPEEWRRPEFWEALDGKEAFALRRQWEAEKAKAGFAGIAWPKEWGGRGGTEGMKAIYDEEMTRARAPRGANQLGLTYLAPTVAVLGSEQQKRDIIGAILRNEEIWCQGFSEPGAGSDLAAIRTSGVLDGDEYIVNGQKIWTTQAIHGDKLFALIRTEPGSQRHQGLSLMLIDMDQPGVEARPITTMSGDQEFGEVFLTDARVPAESNLGGIGNGWQTAMLLLSFERGASAFGMYTAMRQQLAGIVAAARATHRNGATAAEDPVLRQQLAAVVTELECLRYHSFHVLSQTEKGRDLGFEASMTKLQWSETMQDLFEVFDDILGPNVTVRRPFEAGPDGSPADITDLAALQNQGLYSRSVTIWGGSGQVQRNVVAERVLGLPR
jgi:alkylation response protein AidB-like acyl-CoA dehydrogenase